jgi:hypothetical protein
MGNERVTSTTKTMADGTRAQVIPITNDRSPSADRSAGLAASLGDGRPLDSSLQQSIEGQFGRDLGHVRIHSDERAGRLADSIGARAFTLRNHVVFGSGNFRPYCPSGRRLLMHELTHVVQQQPDVRDAGLPATLDGWRVSARNDLAEREAERSADLSASDEPITIAESARDVLQADWDWGRAGAGALIGGAIGAAAGFLFGGGVGAAIGGGIGAVAGGLIGGLTGGSRPTLSLSNDRYSDSGNTSQKQIHFDVTVPSGLQATDYCLVNKVQGTWTNPDGTYSQATLYGGTRDINFPSEVIDSVDADPVYWSDPTTGRWNYRTTPTGFMATDSPGGHPFAPGEVAAVRFHIGLYTLASVQTTTSGTISATPIQELPWQFSVRSSAAGVITHPTL